MISTKSVASRRAASNRASKKAQDETLLTAINHGQPWHPTEDKRILEGTCLRLLAVELGRTYYACRIRRINLHNVGRAKTPTATTAQRLVSVPAPELHPALEAYRAKTTPALVGFRGAVDGGYNCSLFRQFENGEERIAQVGEKVTLSWGSCTAASHRTASLILEDFIFYTFSHIPFVTRRDWVRTLTPSFVDMMIRPLLNVQPFTMTVAEIYQWILDRLPSPDTKTNNE